MALKAKDDARELAAALSAEGSRPEKFGSMKAEALKYSFRFEQRLASVLSVLVYGRRSRLVGMGRESLIVDVIDVAGEPANDKCNLAQAQQAAAIARQLDRTSWAILTPYTNQRDAIKEKLARLKERVLTVHAAQGQEWDTVIYCAADSNWKSRFLNDSSKPDGQECLNTALSRVRRRLILILDRTHWEHRPDRHRQLLSRLIALSRR